MTGPFAPGWRAFTVAGLVGAVALLARHPTPASPGHEPLPGLPENTATGGGGGGRGRYGPGPGPRRSQLGLNAEDVKALGVLDRAEVFRVIHRNRQQLRYCYESAQVHAPKLAGRVEAHFLLGPDGRVKASAITSTTGNADLEQCLIARFRSWDWPKAAEGGQTEVRFPFELSPGEE